MKANELTGLSDEQLVHRELELERALINHTFRHRLNRLENTSLLGRTRKDIARCETLLTDREKSQGLQKGSLKAKYSSSWTTTAPSQGGDQEAGAGFLKGILDTKDATE